VPELGAFWSGAVGFFGYDVVRHVERLPHPPPRVIAAPDALFVFTRALLILDNLRGLGRIVVAVPVPAGAPNDDLRRRYDTARAEIDAIEARLAVPAPLAPLRLDPSAPPARGTSTYPHDRFVRDVERIREYIAAGDCFQALLARRIELPHDFEGATLYRALRTLNPSPYMYHLDLDGVELVGSSPELLVRVADGRVTLRPIAGTRPRGATPDEDDRLAAELLADEKERAEHLMLVDLGRNDVGRVARYGTVRVTDLMSVERYSHVLHIVSQVEGDLREGLSALDAFRAAFPAGTMTGAPKVRAMEIIDELEPERRGPYAGAVGYVASGDARMDLAITIRTCVITGGVASIQAGAGIVADSVPEREWEETENKARALLTALGRVHTAR
jgi:anthranilate synthase component 1